MMIPLRIGDIAQAVHGTVHGVEKDVLVQSVITDSRSGGPDSMFVAIAGERVDGHDFVSHACANGSVVALCDRVMDQPCIVVSDPVAALGSLASWYRNNYLTCTVIGITGSSGKTTTKDLIHQVCSAAGPTVSAPGSFNTDVGFPLTVLDAQADTRFLVLEMGMRGIGHIARLVSLVKPDIGVVVNVGTAHLESLGSQQAIATAKAELVTDLDPDAVAVLNQDDPFVRHMITPARRWTFGESAGVDARAENVTIDERACPQFDLVIGLERANVHLALHGEHYVSNALAAASVGSLIGLSTQQIAQALTSARPRSRWRMEVVKTKAGFTVINDAYNANPESMRAALKALIAMRGEGRVWAVLGEMRELGDDSVVEHDAIGRLIVRLDVDQLICVGDKTRVMHLAASNEGSWGEESAWVPDIAGALSLLEGGLKPHDVVLVKASRSIGLDQLADSLIHQIGGGEA
jgi:UDP-N-acetylmuramoyl-tripeptide--D-alanyl-D-alanine ligase